MLRVEGFASRLPISGPPSWLRLFPQLQFFEQALPAVTRLRGDPKVIHIESWRGCLDVSGAQGNRVMTGSWSRGRRTLSC